jgi:purine-binding chemotaxis protein CheW
MTEAATVRLLLWRVGGARCGAPLEQLREVLPAMPLARIPGAAAAVSGVANVRGELVTVVDGRTLLGEADTTPAEAIVLVRVGRRTVGLAVDEVEDLVTVSDAVLLPGSQSAAAWTVQVDGGAVVRLLDLEGLLGPLFQG